MLRRSLALAVAALLAAAGPACSSRDGRVLPPPDPGATTTSVSTPVVAQPMDGDGLVEVFSLASTAFTEGEQIPPRHTCAGEGISPPLSWASTPPAAELALVVRDRTADGFVHWVVTGIDPVVQGLGEGAVPEGAVEARNDAGSVGWSAPCPPNGTHTYELSLHVLPERLTLEGGAPPDQAALMVEGASTVAATLTATVSAEP
ncbi:MAG: YbhB/YbcL family Raf kinase inhibitor-like protein [Acidimicrobiales bacterium]